MIPRYAELQVASNFSFLRGASHPPELAEAACDAGHAAIGITDRNTLAGAVRMHSAAKQLGFRFVLGCRLDLTDDASLLVYPIDRTGYGRLCRLLTMGKRRAEKGECHIGRSDVMGHAEGLLAMVLPPDGPDADLDAAGDFARTLAGWAEAFGDRCYLAGHHLYRGDDARRLAQLDVLARRFRAPLVATNDVHAHGPERRPLQDVLTCIREGCTITEAGSRLFANAERYIKPPAEMARLFAHHPDAIARTMEIVERTRFSLGELRYEYPVEEITRDGLTPQQVLEEETWKGARIRYPSGIPDKVREQLHKELALVSEREYAPFFLTVHDIVRKARELHILCQGRGSAANSSICYCLGITEVDPSRFSLLFERFISTARDEPPDIDVDFEHERREEIIQYIYGKYTRERAGIAATVITYRARSAIRDVGKAMGLSLDAVSALAATTWGVSDEGFERAWVREAGLDPDDPHLRAILTLTGQLMGFPRHLSQHVGGFVITRGPLEEVVPIGNAAMEDRTFVEWDKDDLNDLGILKVDVLALGMLTCIRKAFDLLAAHGGPRLTLATVPQDDPQVYAMLGRADSLGVFQVESRAQMSFLPRMKPKTLYDLVIQVAIVRPGPIQGDMVHPYLRRREGKEPIGYPKEELRPVLDRTLGVPLFQEQAMSIAMVAAGFTGAEADGLRRSMAAFRRDGRIEIYRDKMIEGMVGRGYPREFAERCFKQIEGFGEYGFPESHAASFALLVYVSAWIKCRHPAVFAAALLNSQPMGFYASAQIVRDAREHEVEVRPVDINCSAWDATLEIPDAKTSRHADAQSHFAVRLGFREVKGFSEDSARALVGARSNGYATPHAVMRRAKLPRAALERLAEADVFRPLGLERREALWAIKAIQEPLPLLASLDAPTEEKAPLPSMAAGEEVMADYATLHLTLRDHPVAFLRSAFAHRRIVPCSALAELPPGSRTRVAGLVLVRQQPGSAKGVIFVTLEDETGVANVVVWQRTFERFRRPLLTSRLLAVTGKIQREGIVIHLVAERLADLSDRLADLADSRESGTPSIRGAGDRLSTDFRSRDFH